jgi:23S rRNA (cytosine1962-C5)-methyltransferase
MSDLPVIRLQPGRHKRAAHGYPWVYSNEIAMDAAAKALPRGALVRLEAADGRALGTATFNPHTLIAARILSADPGRTIDAAFFSARIRHARDLRDRMIGRPFYRLIHAEADGLGGLIIDRYGDVLSVQITTAGMDRLVQPLLDALAEVMAPSAIVLRREPAHEAEGLAPSSEIARGSLDGPVEIEENGVRFLADPARGQKTGWYYDQRDNRAFMAGLAKGARCLDLYAYGGGFALAMAKAGAVDVTAVDRSADALALAERSAQANGLRCNLVRAEVFAELERLAAAGERYGVVAADPPAFVKSRKDLPTGTAAYRKLARLAATLVAPGGFLFLASCSHNMEETAFAGQAARGIERTGRNGRILRKAGAAPDHPVHPQLPESAYLKALVFQLD